MTELQLYNSILQQAIEGRLVPQDASDEPAGVLLKRIREERALLVKEKKMKAPKHESLIFRGEDGLFYERVGKSVKCIQEEIPFDIPSSWEWVRLGEIAEYKKGPFGSSITKDMFVPESKNTIKVYEQKNAIKKDASLGNYYITEEKFKTLKNFSLRPKDIIVSCAGTIGETYVMPDDMKIGIINQALMYIRLYDVSITKFYLAYFKSVLEAEAKLNSKGSAIKNIPPFLIFKKFLFPLPPLKEQQRIVEKLEELQPLCTQYGELQRVLDKLDADFPKQLKQSLLQAAIQGKLTKQDPADEPASELLKRIKAEKDALIKAKKIKAPKVESTIYRKENGSFYERKGKTETCIDDEIPFDIPNSWEWVRFEAICSYIQRGKSPKYSPIKKYPVVAQKCNQWSGFSIEKAQFIDPETVSKYSEERILQDNDLLWNSTGLGTVGRMAIYKEQLNSYNWAVADSHVTVIRLLPDFIIPDYIYSYIASPAVQMTIEDKSSGSTQQKELNLSTVKNVLIPFPPINEQVRINKYLSRLYRKNT